MDPSPKTGLTLFDFCKNSLTTASTSSRMRILLDLLLQCDPTLLDSNPALFQAIPSHDIVAEYAYAMVHRMESSHVLSNTLDSQSFLPGLPYDILREIARKCNTGGP
jgi:hypothetical protein